MPIRIETDEEYHSGDGVSKSGLWELWTKTPFHYRHVEKVSTAEKDMGKATHIAILEPETLEQRIGMSAAPDDRRGNKWKDYVAFCEYNNLIPLLSDQVDQALRIRDLSEHCEQLRIMREGETIVETSAYHIDEETGMLVKTRPDMYSVTSRIICDLKTAANASPDAFAKSVGKFGYHVQEPLYTDVWTKGTGYDVEAFFFVVFEKCNPPTIAVYELDAASVAEGHAIYREALKRYAECFKSGYWPAYPTEVQQIGLKKWDYKLTRPAEEDMAHDDE